jgi:hypothetical protein
MTKTQDTLATVTKTRPADTTAYSAGDVISESTSAGTHWKFTSVVFRNGASGKITRAVLTDDDTGDTFQCVLLLFAVAPTGNLDDNAANTEPLAGTEDDFIGAIEFAALKDLGTGFSYAVGVPGDSKLPMPFKCASGETAIYGVLVGLGTPTPSSGQIFRIILQIEQQA